MVVPYIDSHVIEVKGAERITCLDMLESFIMSSQDRKLCSVHPFSVPALPMRHAQFYYLEA